MVTREALSNLLGDVYDAATDARQWPAALRQIGKVFDCPQVNLVASGEPRRVMTFGADPLFQRSYVQHYFKCNVLAQRAKPLAAGTVVSDRGLLTRYEYRRSEFRNEFVRPQGMEQALMAIVIREGAREAVMSLWRPQGQRAWEADHFDALAILTPHLNRALRVTVDVKAARERSAAYAEALDATGEAVILVSAARKAVFVSRMAERAVAAGDGLGLRHRQVYAFTPAEHAALERAIALALDTEPAAFAPVEPVKIRRPSGRMPYVIQAIPLRLSERFALLILTDTDREPRVSSALLKTLFGLTPAETAVALCVLEGGGLNAVAATLGITLSTVRVHLQRVFEKTNTHRQADLVRTLLRLRDARA